MGNISDERRRKRSHPDSARKLALAVPSPLALAEGGVWVLLIVSPLALGSVSETASALLEAGCIASFLLAWGFAPRQSSARLPRGLSSVVGLFVIWTLVQMIPMPPAVLSVVSPGTHHLYQATLPAYGTSGPTDLQDWLLNRKKDDSRDLKPRRENPTGIEGQMSIRPRWKPISWNSGQTLRMLSRFLAYWCVFVLLIRYLPERASGRRLPSLVLILGAAVSFLGILQYLTWNGKIFWTIPVYQGSPFGPWVNRNHFSGFVAMAFFLGVGVILEVAGVGGRHRRRSRRSRIPLVLVSGFLLLCMAAGLVLAGSRGGLFSMGLTLAGYVLARGVRARRRFSTPLPMVAAVLPLVLFGIGIGWYVSHGGGLETGVEANVEPSLGARLRAWEGVGAMIAADPLSGTGLGTFGEAYPVFKTPGLILRWEQAHNDYLQFLSESGLVGLGLLGVGAFLFFRGALVPVLLGNDRSIRAHSVGAGLGVVALLIHSGVDFNLQIPSNGLLFVVLAAIVVRGGAEFRGTAGGKADGSKPGSPSAESR